jgi:type IV secretory pathway TraG/TraD family ATPase VirD4
MIVVLIIGVFIFLAAALAGKKKEHTYNAEWGDSFAHLSGWNHGFAVTGSKALTKNTSYENCALFGPTGSGKSSVVIISSAASLARGKSSIIFNDVTGEVYEHTSTFLAGQGYKVLRLDFSNSKNSETFNPLLECKSISDIQKVALLIIRNSIGPGKGDVFWEQSSIMLLSLFARYLVFHTEPEFRTLQNVLYLIEKFAVDGATVDKMFIRTGDEELLSAYKATIVVGDKTLQSIIATARTALNLFCDNEVCRTTASNSIDFNLLRDEPVALYVCNPLKDLMYFRPLSALFFQSLFNFVLSRIPGKDERSIFFVMDEAATMRFPDLSATISNIRKFKAGILLCMQDEMALSSQYGQAEAHQIKTNCGTQIYLKGQPLHTASELSRILGKHTHIIDDKGTERTRELMTPDEIRMCDEAIILISNKAPLKCKTVPYYKNMGLRRLVTLPAYQLEEKETSDPPLIPLIGNEKMV